MNFLLGNRHTCCMALISVLDMQSSVQPHRWNSGANIKERGGMMYLKDDQKWAAVHFKDRTLLRRDVWLLSAQQVWALENVIEVKANGQHHYTVLEEKS